MSFQLWFCLLITWDFHSAVANCRRLFICPTLLSKRNPHMVCWERVLWNAWWERAWDTARKLISSELVYQFPQGLERKGRLFQRYIIIKVACGDDLTGLSLKLSFCEIVNKLQLVCITFFFFLIEIWCEIFWVFWNSRKARFNLPFICACRLSDPRELLCSDDDKTKQTWYVFFLDSILSTRAHTNFPLNVWRSLWLHNLMKPPC